jgi:hypothetical protein
VTHPRAAAPYGRSMPQRGQATVEYLALLLLVAGGLLAAAHTAWARRPRPPAGDAAYLQLAARFTPDLVLERGGDVERPVDFRRCRRRACSASPGADSVLFLHAVRRRGFLYLEYWEYLPDSRFAHTGIGLVDGAHTDDWEGLIVKLRRDGTVVGARATAHLGFNGRHPWWELAADDWAAYPAAVYRAAGSHAGAFAASGIDLAGDRWNGAAGRVRPRLVAADAAARARAAFDPGSVAPWQKEAWTDPETTITGHPGDHAGYARYARWWARLCAIC